VFFEGWYTIFRLYRIRLGCKILNHGGITSFRLCVFFTIYVSWNRVKIHTKWSLRAKIEIMAGSRPTDERSGPLPLLVTPTARSSGPSHIEGRSLVEVAATTCRFWEEHHLVDLDHLPIQQSIVDLSEPLWPGRLRLSIVSLTSCSTVPAIMHRSKLQVATGRLGDFGDCFHRWINFVLLTTYANQYYSLVLGLMLCSTTNVLLLAMVMNIVQNVGVRRYAKVILRVPEGY